MLGHTGGPLTAELCLLQQMLRESKGVEYEQTRGSVVCWEQRGLENWIEFRRLWESAWLCHKFDVTGGNLLNPLFLPVRVISHFTRLAVSRYLL